MQLSPMLVVLARTCDEAGAVTWQPMQADPFGFTGLINPCGSRTSFKPPEVVCDEFTSHGAASGVAGAALRAHGRETDLGEVVDTPVPANDGIALPGLLQIFARVNPVNQEIKVDALIGLRSFSRIVAFGRCAASVLDGLWQRTHISTSLRLSPCALRSTWHRLQFAMSTICRLD